MTVMASQRPRSGAVIDPDRLRRRREEMGLSPQKLAARITAMGLLPLRPVRRRDPATGELTETGECESISRDALAKFETGERKPTPAVLLAICEALSTPGSILIPANLLIGGPEALPPGDIVRERVTAWHAQLRQFAAESGIELETGEDGELIYPPELTEAFGKFLRTAGRLGMLTAAEAG